MRVLVISERAALGSLPAYAYHNVGGVRHLFVHATPGDPLYRYLGADAAAWAEEVSQAEADVVFVGHTHVQFRLEAAGRMIVNPGSVDPRAVTALTTLLRSGRAPPSSLGSGLPTA